MGETVVEAAALQRRVAELGAEVSRDYAGRDLFMMGVLKGAVFFVADLMRNIEVPCEVDFMAVSSYGSMTDSSGVVRIQKDLDSSIEGKDVLIVEDIVDSGLTLNYLLVSRSPTGLWSATGWISISAFATCPTSPRSTRSRVRAMDCRLSVTPLAAGRAETPPEGSGHGSRPARCETIPDE